MIKTRITYAILFVFVALSVFSQAPGFNNSWINFGQKYYKIKVAVDGLYKLDSASLSAAGVPINTIDPHHIQLFQKGKELYPYIAGEADSVLNTRDYILFYAEKNNGKDDSLLFSLYPNAPYLTNPYFSVINDTSAVFFTWNSSTNNKRLALNKDTTYSSYPNPAPYYMRDIFSNQTDYTFGPYNIVNQNDPRYLTGEGFVSQSYLSQPGNSQSYSSVYSFSFPTQSSYTAGLSPAPYATICFSGGNDVAYASPDHIIQIDYQGNGGFTLGTFSVDAYSSRRISYGLNTNLFNMGGNTTIDVSSLTNPATVINGSTIDNYANVNYIRVVYPQTFNLQGLGQTQEKMYIPDDATGQLKSRLNITNFNNSGTRGILIDTSNRMISFLSATSTDTVLVPNTNTGNPKFCFLSSWSQVDSTLNIKPVNGNGSFVDYLTQSNLDSVYLIVSHPKLIGNGGNSGVDAYKTYRNSNAGGNYNVVLASIADLYDQFAYGVDLHPMAIKNFCGYLINNANTTHIRPPSNLFLIGKGVHAWEAVYQDQGPSASTFATCLVPSFGNPSSDNMLTVGLPGSTFYPEPAIPTGRLAAQSDQDVVNYLDKVQLYEQQSPDSLWRKRAIHFIGGTTPSDQTAFSNYMTLLKHTYQDTLVGGNVFSFYKTSTAPISINTNDSVTQLINQGVSLMTFFGHGSATGFDQNIDVPSAYNNAPRIPFIIANSCLTGDIFSVNDVTSSEQWVLAPGNKGSIGFIATTAEGVALQLYEYSQELYNQFGYKNYGQPYGYCLKNSIKNLMSTSPSAGDSLLMETCQEMTLHGDPAIKANTSTKPDYEITNADVIFDTKTWPTDSIGLKIVMTNNGKAIHTNYSVRVMRAFPNGDTTTVYKTVKAPLYKDTLSFFMFENYTKAVGINNFSVFIDAGYQINESNENNNKTGNIPLFIQGADIEPVWPYEFAIIPNTNTVTLQASTADPFAPTHSYRFQLDTSAFFTSPLVNTLVNATGGVVSLPNVSLLGVDSTVYFWRVAKDSTVPNWKQSSFQVITGKYGWEQAHFYQFRGDGYQYVKWDSAHWSFDFANNVNTVFVNTTIIPSTNNPPPGSHTFTDIQFFLNNLQVQLFTCGLDGWNVGVFNPISGNLMPNDSVTGGNSGGWWHGKYGSCICDNYAVTHYMYNFGTENQCPSNYPPDISAAADWRPNLTLFLNNLAPGTPIIAYTTKADYDAYFHTFSLTDGTQPATDLITAFQSFGSSQIANLNDTTSMIIFGKKGGGAAHEVLSTNRYQLLSLVDTLDQHFKSGYIASEIIGPAQHSDTAWKSLHWRYKSLETPSYDSIVVQVIGIDSNGVRTTLANFTDTSQDVPNLYNHGGGISGKKYPYLQLIAYEADTSKHTPPQLKRWQVMFDPVPEAALYPSGGFTVAANPVSEGQLFKARIPIKNISAFAFTDSLLISYSIEDAGRNMHPPVFQMKRKPFQPDSVMYDTITVNTTPINNVSFAGNNILWIDVNPLNNPKHRLEQYHFNNMAQIPFTVNKDKINPILDVTFDGTHILNGDIVSSKPDILVTLKDENKFLALNDTGNFAIYVTNANSSAQQRIYFNNPQIQYTKAVLPNNSFKINYKPILAQDGLYTLDIKATDRSGNVSGQSDYKIQYEVINKPMITEVLNYPNPFSTSTKFVFTITGNEVPQTFKIQIMTITGKVVKEITREELGYIHIGRNITEYAWDGNDQYGGKLANGVYFYHIVTRLNGSQMEHMNTSADEYFKKGLGKMVIMR
ncbi:MAG TPA: C25 family cysteine peptidase [Bacteroidia bacterium]|nr:C25 family cysteine peptidase [Bacteroidia bacterium]